MTTVSKYITRAGERAEQDPKELEMFLDFVVDKKVKSYLEVGCRNGDTFYAVMKAIGKGGYGVAIDLPENAYSMLSLANTAFELETEGISARMIHGNSTNEVVISDVNSLIGVKEWGNSYDLILIDGDHSYEGVKKDWENYARYTYPRFVAFHDITAPPGWISEDKENEVRKFWEEIKVGKNTLEIINPGSNMGFGILL